ncbi:hypothetical protein RJ639_035373 [Escallonia herrerae]|uniref:Uncharacterized protein n=1 Tax=Escallonia herrerae TaxID=1293975 RepID=A0AA89BGL2_9ASTE|nr:hypothetical protein RJ639_035373 [Escallonia herrerae]
MKPLTPIWEDPVAALANTCHEFGEHGGVNMSIEASATFTFTEPETMRHLFSGELGPDRDFFIYIRHFKPTMLKFGSQMAALEGTEAAYYTASGMSVISLMLMQLCSSGDHVVASQTLYGGTHALLTHFFPRACNITTSFIDLRDCDTVKAAIVKGMTKVLYFEAVLNPTLTMADVPELCRIAHDKGLTVVIDNTFAPMVLSQARPASSEFTFRIVARVTEHSVIGVSLGAMPKLGLRPVGESLMQQATASETPKQGEQNERGGDPVRDHVIEFLLMKNCSEEAGNAVPKSVSNLLVHIISTHVDHLQDVVTKLEIELDSVDLELDKGPNYKWVRTTSDRLLDSKTAPVSIYSPPAFRYET